MRRLIALGFRKLQQALQLRRYLSLIPVAIPLGIAVGYAAIGFRYTITQIQNLFTLDSGNLTAAVAALPWYAKLAIPSLGGLITGLITTYYAREARGVGVPEVMESVIQQNGEIRTRVILGKFLASSVTIGSGGSVGREGPIVQIGAAIGSLVGRVLHLPPDKLRLIVGCAAAAGIAATFNAPIAGVLFSVEVILGHFAIHTFSPLVVASVAATIVSRVHLGDHPAFTIPSYKLQFTWEVGFHLLLSIMIGLMAVGFMILLRRTGQWLQTLKIPAPALGMVGGCLVGMMFFVFPELYGVGYDTVAQMLRGDVILGSALLLVLAKAVATSVTVGSGGSGGIFAPSLFIGASFGGAFGRVLQLFQPAIQPGGYAVVGMAAMVAATTHAPLTTLLMVYEMTSDYGLILPIMISTIAASMLTHRLYGHSLYTQKLADRGVDLNDGLESQIMCNSYVDDLMRTDIPTLRSKMPVHDALRLVINDPHHQYYVVDEHDQPEGVLSIYAINRFLSTKRKTKKLARVREIMQRTVETVCSDDSLAECMKRFTISPMDELPVIERIANRDVLVGTISEKDIMSFYNREVLHQGALGLKYVHRTGDRQRQDFVMVGPEESVSLFKVTKKMVGLSLKDLNLRERYHINVVAVKHLNDDGSIDRSVPDPDKPFGADDSLVIAGNSEWIQRFVADFGKPGGT